MLAGDLLEEVCVVYAKAQNVVRRKFCLFTNIKCAQTVYARGKTAMLSVTCSRIFAVRFHEMNWLLKKTLHVHEYYIFS